MALRRMAGDSGGDGGSLWVLGERDDDSSRRRAAMEGEALHWAKEKRMTKAKADI